MTEFSYIAKGPLYIYLVNLVLANETLVKFDTTFRLLHCTVPSILISKNRSYATWLKGRKRNFYFRQLISMLAFYLVFSLSGVAVHSLLLLLSFIM